MFQQQIVVQYGEYVLKTTEIEKQFDFCRKDGERLRHVENSDILFFISPYLLAQENGEWKNYSYKCEALPDGKCIRVTVYDASADTETSSNAVRPRPNFLKRLDLLFKDYFG